MKIVTFVLERLSTMSKKKAQLLKNESQELIDSLNHFINWLHQIKVIKDIPTKMNYVEFPFSSEDWFMRVEGDTVSFNTDIRNRCSFEYYKTVVLHEAFHFIVQKVPNKGDAIRIKDSFGDQLMKLIDIEADFYTALYYKEHLKFSLVSYLGLYFDGKTVFNDERIRTAKFERFIGSLLSVAKLFIDNPKGITSETNYDLYLPTIAPVYTENKLHVLVIRKEHIYLDEIQATHQDFVELKACYANADNFTKKAYINKLVKFIFDAFTKTISAEMKNEISKIKN